MKDLCGVINIYKEKGFTSHDVVNIVRNRLGKIKTGHTGTLDPDAEGVLPICIGKATKLAELIASDKKRYRAEMTLGIATTTQDISGEITDHGEIPKDRERILSVISDFKGELLQTPPMYSAIKVNGKKLYELARQGIEIERKKRTITIFDIKAEFISDNKLILDVFCSKGTYIRTLCHDIGLRLGCFACMSALTRTQAGSFGIETAVKIEDFKRLAENSEAESIILSPETVLPDLKRVKIKREGEKFLKNGNPIGFELIDTELNETDEKFFVYDYNGKLTGIYKIRNNFLMPDIMLI